MFEFTPSTLFVGLQNDQSGVISQSITKIVNSTMALDRAFEDFINTWNKSAYALLKALPDTSDDLDPWRHGLHGETIYLSSEITNSSVFWDRANNRSMSIASSAALINNAYNALEGAISALDSKAIATLQKYLHNRFTSFLDTPAHIQANSLVRYSQNKLALEYIPFAEIAGLSGPSSFISLSDTPGVLVNDRVLAIESNAIVYKDLEYMTRHTVGGAPYTSINFSTMYGPLPECDKLEHVFLINSTAGLVVIDMDLLPEAGVFTFVVEGTNGLRLDDAGSLPSPLTFDNSSSLLVFESVTITPDPNEHRYLVLDKV